MPRVTGGTGIDTAICRRLADDGFRVIAGDGNADRAECWQANQKTLGYDIAFTYANVANFEFCQHCDQSIVERYGPVSVLVSMGASIRSMRQR